MSLEIEKQLEQQYVMPTFGRYEVEFVSGHGMVLTDSEGNDYLDFLSGIGVCSLGHCNPIVVSAITEQAQKLIHVGNYFYIEKRGEVAKLISDLLNHGSEGAEDWKTFFANSGAEANECAIKLARVYAQKVTVECGDPVSEAPSTIITLTKSFHGRTLATLAATGQPVFHKGFEPIPAGFLNVPINDVDALKQAFAESQGSVCAVMLEPIQGESGVNLCTPEYMRAVRDLCDANDALMICDEVQTGVFRTGKPFAFQGLGIIPDVVTIAKGVASGVPTGACAAKAHVADAMTAGKHGSTFGGSNLAISAIYATLTELSKPAYAKSINEVGEYLRSRLMEVPGVVGVRGTGLMNAAELDDRYEAHDVVKAALGHGLVLNATGPTTLRFLPPLICEKDDVDSLIQRLTDTLSAATL